MGIESDDESAIWNRAREGDGAAFAELFRLHRDRIYRRALALVSDSHDAEDITASAFFELWRKRRSVSLVEGSIVPWLLVTAVNLTRNHRRGTRRYRALLASLPRGQAIDAESAALAKVETELLGLRLTTAITRLSATDAALLILTVLDGLSIADAAAAVGVTPGAARMRLHRARLRLRVVFGENQTLIRRSTFEGEHG